MSKVIRYIIVYIVSFTFFLPLFLSMFIVKKEPITFWCRYVDLHLNFVDWVWKGYKPKQR